MCTHLKDLKPRNDWGGDEWGVDPTKAYEQMPYYNKLVLLVRLVW